VVIEAGDRTVPFLVVTAGQVEVVLPASTTAARITTHGPGQLGDAGRRRGEQGEHRPRTP